MGIVPYNSLFFKQICFLRGSADFIDSLKEAVCTASLIFASLRDLLPPGGNNIFVLSDVGYDMFNKLIILSFC